MTESLLILFALAGFGAAGWFFFKESKTREALAAERARSGTGELDAVRAERDRLGAELAAERAQSQQRAEELAAERARAMERDRAAGEREAALKEANAVFEKNFEALATRALSQSEQRFLNLANETFQKHQVAAAGGVKQVLAPVEEQFKKLAESVGALDKARTEDKSALETQMKFVGETLARTQVETSKLVNALRAAPKTRGRWGEETLKNVLEMSGLSPHCDFSEQTTVRDDEGAQLRPDVIINLPGGRSIIVDAKVALSGYLDALDATDDVTREAHLKKHAQELRTHVKALSSKDYSKQFAQSADFVALFIPGENFFAAAVERDPDLFEDAMKLRVVIVTPVTLMALARSIAYGWRQEQQARNAQEIAEHGRQIYERLAKMSEYIGGVGGAITTSVKKYNELVSSFESRVMPSARRFKDLGVADAGVELREVDHVDLAPRLPAPQGELELGAPGKKKAG